MSIEDVTGLLNVIDKLICEYKNDFILNNVNKILTHYSWDKLVDEHEKYFKEILLK